MLVGVAAVPLRYSPNSSRTTTQEDNLLVLERLARGLGRAPCGSDETTKDDRASTADVSFRIFVMWPDLHFPDNPAPRHMGDRAGISRGGVKTHPWMSSLNILYLS